jgi:hypothetical protein
MRISMKAPLQALYDSLCRDGAPRPADVIFVFGGHPERKRFGLELWRQAYAPVLVLSVARFEWRRFAELGLPDDGGLLQLVEATPPVERHFFVVVRDRRVEAYRVKARGLGTWREAEALHEYLVEEKARSVLLVSSAMHLRRAVMTVHAMSPSVAAYPAPTPGKDSVVRRDGWWRVPKARRAVLREALKLLLYRLRLALTALFRRGRDRARPPGSRRRAPSPPRGSVSPRSRR